MNPEHQPNGVDYGHQTNAVNLQRQQNGVISTTRYTPNGVNSGYQTNGINLPRQQNGVISTTRYTPNGVNSGYQPNGMNAGRQPNGVNAGYQPNGINSGYQSNGINPQHQQNGVISPTRYTVNGISSQHEREGPSLERQQSQSAPRGRTPMHLQPAPMVEDDYPVTAIRIPVSADERPHYVDLEIRDYDLPGCRCRFPDLRRFFGEYPVWDTDFQMFRALWEPPGMESLHGTYIIFAIRPTIDDNRPHLEWNGHFIALLKGDVFIMKVKESIDERAAFTDPLGYPVRTLPHHTGVGDARYEHIERCFLDSDLFTEMTLAATNAYSRVDNPSSVQLPIPVGFWRAFVQGRVRITDYQVPPVTPAMDTIMARFSPPHRPSSPPWIAYDVRAPR